MNEKNLKVFFIYCLLLTLFSTTSAFLLNIFKSNSLYFTTVRIYTIVEFSLFAVFFSITINNKLFSKILLFSIIPFVLFSALQWIKNYPIFETSALLIEFIFYLIVLVYFFYEQMIFSIEKKLYESSIFWISVGLFIYFSGNFFYLITSTLKGALSEKNLIQISYSIVTIIKNVILFYAVMINYRKEFFLESYPDNINNKIINT